MIGDTLLGKTKQTLLGHTLDTAEAFKRYWIYHGNTINERISQLGYSSALFYQIAQFSVLCHDLGKATKRWQQYIRSIYEEKHCKKPASHALYSLMIANDFLTAQDLQNKHEGLAALLAILAHHQMLHNDAFQGERIRGEGTNVVVPALKDVIAYLENINHYIQSDNYREQYTSREAVELVVMLKNKVKNIENKELIKFKGLYTLYLSIIVICDFESSYYYSKYEKEIKRDIPPMERLIKDEVIERLIFNANETLKGFDSTNIGMNPNYWQKAVMQTDNPYVLLQAGCGAGKTGAAICFFKHQLELKRATRLIFTLPTQFTSNSIYWDLTTKYGVNEKHKGLYHSEVETVLFSESQNLEYEDAKTARDWVRTEKLQNTFFNKPITITTVDHLLYSLLHCYKYADVAFGNIMTSAVIFDELHYYDQYTLDKIGECLRLLRNLGIPHLVMSATMPDAVKEKLQKQAKRQKLEYVIIPDQSSIQSNAELKASMNQVPFLIEKADEPIIDDENKLSEHLIKFLQNHLQCRQMLVVNTVQKAKAIAKDVRKLWPDKNIICYHSEFTREHREIKEKLIKAFFCLAKDRTTEQKELIAEYGFTDNNQLILITTQICELSLDISADIMYSEIAPVDAVGQRGGRLHRRGQHFNKNKCSCHYCKNRNYLPNSFQYRMILFPLPEGKALPYEEQIVQASWNIIGKAYSQQKLQQWVNEIYPDAPSLADRNMKTYIIEDAVFGRQPKERFGDPNEDASQGIFRVRESKFTVDTVVPAQFYNPKLQPADMLKKYGVKVARYKIKDCYEYIDGVKVVNIPYTFNYGFDNF